MRSQAENTQSTTAVHDGTTIAWASTRMCHLTPKITHVIWALSWNSKAAVHLHLPHHQLKSAQPINLSSSTKLSRPYIFFLTHLCNHVLQETGGSSTGKAENSYAEGKPRILVEFGAPDEILWLSAWKLGLQNLDINWRMTLRKGSITILLACCRCCDQFQQDQQIQMSY